MFVQVSLAGQLRLIKVDTLRRVDSVGFLVIWIIHKYISCVHSRIRMCYIALLLIAH